MDFFWVPKVICPFCLIPTCSSRMGQTKQYLGKKQTKPRSTNEVTDHPVLRGIQESKFMIQIGLNCIYNIVIPKDTRQPTSYPHQMNTKCREDPDFLKASLNVNLLRKLRTVSPLKKCCLLSILNQTLTKFQILHRAPVQHVRGAPPPADRARGAVDLRLRTPGKEKSPHRTRGAPRD